MGLGQGGRTMHYGQMPRHLHIHEQGHVHRWHWSAQGREHRWHLRRRGLFQHTWRCYDGRAKQHEQWRHDEHPTIIALNVTIMIVSRNFFSMSMTLASFVRLHQSNNKSLSTTTFYVACLVVLFWPQPLITCCQTYVSNARSYACNFFLISIESHWPSYSALYVMPYLYSQHGID